MRIIFRLPETLLLLIAVGVVVLYLIGMLYR